jgi:hypothetical protein
MDSETKNALVEHFKIFHQIVIPASKTGSADIKSPKEVLEQYMTTDRRAMLLYMLALGTGHESFETFKEQFVKNDKGDAVPNAVLAIGMATDVLSRAVSPKEVGPAVKCMSNMFRQAGDKQCEISLRNFKVITSATAGTAYTAKEVIKACLESEVMYKPNDPVAVIADNVNWKVVMGRLAGTVMSWTLVAHGLPKDNSDLSCFYGENALSRDRGDWMKDFVEKMSADELISKVFLGRVLAMTMLTLQSIGAWSEKQEDKPREPDTDFVYSMLEPGEQLVRELLHTDLIGTDLLIEYVKKFAMTAELVGEREGTGMSKTEYTVDAAKEEGKRLVGLACSVSAEKLNKGTIPELLHKMEALRTHVMDGFPDMPKLAKKRKPDIRDALIRVRKKPFAANPALSAQFAQAGLDRVYGGKVPVKIED